ncbi:TPA: restriction endonuclease subunit S [Streptococcus suis]
MGDTVIEIIAGGDVDKNKVVNDGKYPIYANSQNGDGIVGYYDDYYRIKGPAVTVTGRGEVGFAKARETDFTPVVRLLAIRSNHNHYFLENSINLHRVIVESTGVPQLTAPQLSLYRIFFPRDIQEENQIGTFFSTLDQQITLHQRKLDKLKHVKQAYLSEMFPAEGERVPKRRFPGFTDAWELRKLGEVVDVCSGRDYKHLETGSIPVYGTGGYMLSVSEALSKNEDAIGIGRKGTIDSPYILRAPFWTVDTLFYCIPQNDFTLEFAYSVFQNINWKSMDESTGVPSLSKNGINNVRVLTPKIQEQSAIGTFFSTLDRQITLHQRKLEKLKNLKKALLNELFV